MSQFTKVIEMMGTSIEAGHEDRRRQNIDAVRGCLQYDDACHYTGDAHTFAEFESIAKSADFTRVELSPSEIGLDRLVGLCLDHGKHGI